MKRSLDLNKIKENDYIIVSTEEALKDIIPFEYIDVENKIKNGKEILKNFLSS